MEEEEEEDSVSKMDDEVSLIGTPARVCIHMFVGNVSTLYLINLHDYV